MRASIGMRPGRWRSLRCNQVGLVSELLAGHLPVRHDAQVALQILPPPPMCSSCMRKLAIALIRGRVVSRHAQAQARFVRSPPCRSQAGSGASTHRCRKPRMCQRLRAESRVSMESARVSRASWRSM